MINVKDFYFDILNKIKNTKTNFYNDSYGNQATYPEFYSLICKVNYLLGDSNSQKVVVLAEKNFINYSCIISIVLSGNIWIPLSLETPINRNLKIIKSLKPDIIITDQKLDQNHYELLKKMNIRLIGFEKFKNCNKFKYEFNLDHKRDETAIIYFTSGSSGTPKGVKISNKSLATAVSKIVPLLEISNKKLWGDYHDLSFVISINIFFKCLYTNGSIYCGCSKSDTYVPNKSIIDNQVNCLITVPTTLLRMKSSQDFKFIFKSLKTIVSCGEPFPIDLMSEYLNKSKDVNLFNFYGSTELTTWIFYHKCLSEDSLNFSKYGYVPIGKPIVGNNIKLIENNLLIVDSPQITNGYLNKKENFHLMKYDNKFWFSTGDVVEKHKDLYICKGRIDNQIKLSGYRIHLMDIETQIKKMDHVDDCLCFSTKDSVSEHISAILITKKNISILQLRSFLKDKLPNYMMPRKVHLVKKKPTNKNGKLDRARLLKTIQSGLGT